MKNMTLVLASGKLSLGLVGTGTRDSIMLNHTLENFFANDPGRSIDVKSNDMLASTRTHSITNDLSWPYRKAPIGGEDIYKEEDMETVNPCAYYTKDQFLVLLYALLFKTTDEQKAIMRKKSLRFIVQEDGRKLCINLVFNGWKDQGSWYIRAFETFSYCGYKKDEETKEQVHVFIPTGQHKLGEEEASNNDELLTQLIEGPKTMELTAQ